MKAYKIFNPDLTCRNFQFEIGKRYKIEGKPILCNRGFHACVLPNKVFSYYDFDSKNIVCEVYLHGDIVGDESDKVCTNDIEIIRQLTWEEVLKICNQGADNTGHSNTGDRNTGDRNTGDRNTGDRNTGHRNTGHRNTGDRNTGDRNTGDRNTGDWNTGDRNTGHSNTGDRNTGDWNTGHRNTGDRNTGHWNTGHWNTGHWNTGHWNTGHWNTGFFNTNEPKLRIFNKESDINRNDINFPDYFYFDFKEWIWYSQMTDEEKEKYPSAKTCDGYLKEISYKDAWKKAFENANKNEIELTKLLPNFDAKIFFEITGIDYFLNH